MRHRTGRPGHLGPNWQLRPRDRQASSPRPTCVLQWLLPAGGQITGTPPWRHLCKGSISGGQRDYNFHSAGWLSPLGEPSGGSGRASGLVGGGLCRPSTAPPTAPRAAQCQTGATGARTQSCSNPGGGPLRSRPCMPGRCRAASRRQGTGSQLGGEAAPAIRCCSRSTRFP